MSNVQLVLAIASAILGIVGVIESNGRNWSAWGVVCLAAMIDFGICVPSPHPDPRSLLNEVVQLRPSSYRTLGVALAVFCKVASD